MVTELDGNLGLFGQIGTVQVGDPFSGRFSYEIGPGSQEVRVSNAFLIGGRSTGNVTEST